MHISFDKPKREVVLDAALVQRLKDTLEDVEKETALNRRQLLKLLEQDEDLVPATIFTVRELGVLEAVVKFLREVRGYPLHKIAALLKRDNRTIWSTYEHSRQKYKGKMPENGTDIKVPLNVFSDRKLGVLEALVRYLKERYSMRYSEIGNLLSRDQRTVWTVYNRARKKCGKE